MKKTIFILNYAPHYRLFLFNQISDELDADFYFGDIPNSSIKKIDYQKLRNFKKEFKTFKLLSFLWCKNSVSLVFKPYKYYVLTGDPYILSNWIILILAMIFNKKTFLWTHGWYGRETKTKKVIKKMYFGLADKILLYNEKSKFLMINEGFQEKKLIPIYNSLDYDKQKSIRDKLKKSTIYSDYFKNDHPVLIYIGRIQKSKKIELVFEAIELLNLDSFPVNFIVIGEEQNDYKLNSYVTYRKLESQVWLYGPSYNEKEIGNLLFNADLCVSPGNVGLTAVHSLMFGTPVLTHSNYCNQMPEFECVKNGFNGGFFIENDVCSLVSKIKELINLKITDNACFNEIDKKWNPHNQIHILKKVLNESDN